MPTVREILGDEFATLQGQGKSNDEIIAIAKDRLKNPPQIIVPQALETSTPADNIPAWYKGESGNGLIDFGGDVLRGVGHTGLSYYNLLQGGDEKTTKLLQKLEGITEEKKAKGRTPERAAEVKQLQDEYSSANTFGEKFKAGLNTVADTLATPSEWQVGEFIGNNIDPINLLPAGRGLLAGATIGAITNGVQAGAFTLPRTDKTGLDAAVDATLGAAAGAVLGGATGGLTKKVPLSKDAGKSDYAAASDGLGLNEAVEGEVIRENRVDEKGILLDPFDKKTDPLTFEAEIVNKKSYEAFAALVNKEEQSVRNVDAVVKNIGEEMQAAGATPEQVEIRIADELKPSAESLAITNVLNDGLPVTPRLSGLNIQQAIINSIQNPTKTAPEFFDSMVIHGFTEEIAAAATKAYETKEIAHFSVFAHDKLTANMDKIIDVEAVRAEAKKDILKIANSNEIDISYKLAYEALPIEDTKTATQQSALFGDEQRLLDVVGDTRLKTPKWAESLVSDTVRYEDIVRDVTNAKNGDKPTPLAKRAMAAMASDELQKLKKHQRFDEVLNFTRDLESKDGVSPQRLENGRKVTTVDNVDSMHTTVEGAAYSKNYAHDFSLTKARVKRIESDRATLQDVESLKADLDMIENNPTYALPTEAELRARYEEQALNPARIFDIAEFEKLQQRFDPQTYAEARELFGETTQEEKVNVTNYTRDLARDSGISKTANRSDAGVNDTARGSNSTGVEQTQRIDGRDELSQQGDSGASNSFADLFRESSDTELYKQNRANSVDESLTGDNEYAGSGRVDGDGIQPESAAETATSSDTKPQQKQSSDASLDSSDRELTQRVAAQKEAQLTPVKPNDQQNIHDTLPILLKEQREDVIKAEKRFFGSNERGMLFTNGTGTGKTFTGLGIAKRFERMGKKDIVVLVPSEAKALDWIEDAKLVNLNIRKLKSVKDSGEGDIIVTTYENFRDNAGLRARSIDLLISDESHKIMGNKDGKHTANLEALREITGYYRNAKARARSHFADQRAALDAKIEKVGGRYEEAAAPFIQELKELDDQAQVMAREINSKTKAVFLSASPFASHKALRYADDYLFNFESDKWADREYNGAYNAGSAEDNFFMSNFGYKMRYNKLTRPDAEVNVDMMERTFAEKMRESGAMSGRILDVDKDYQRAFVLVDSDIGKKIDAGFETLNADKELGALRGVMRASYMDTVSLMEAIKAQEAVSRIKGHLEAGRKVVVYHTFVDATPSHPFRLDKYIEDAVSKAAKDDYYAARDLRSKLETEYSNFKNKYPELYNLDLGSLATPTKTISDAFGDDVVMFNRLAGSKKSVNKNRFNNNEVDIIMVNESGKEGISLHDKDGDKQRVLINLTLPIKPIDMIQVEGRIYRTGQKSDAIFEYLTLHTNFEKRYFGSSINERVATVENLAMGEQSRALRSAIKEGYLSAEVIEAGALDGKGGKAFDMRAEGDKVMGSPFNYAKTLYFGKQKGRQNHRGADFFATPDPLGFKMVEWADIRANDRVLEPSAGVGAIGKWFPANSVNNFIEQSSDLFSDLGIAVQGKVQQMDFMELDLHNKYDAIVMNPPFGKASVTAIEHLQKAMKHTSEGGRIVMLAPNNMMEKASFKKMLEDKAFSGWVLQDEMRLSDVVFERAGTKVMTSVYVFNKTSSKDMLNISNRYTKHIQADNINSFFDEIESLDIDKREVPRALDEVAAEISVVVSDMPIEIGVFKHTKTGEDMTVVKLGDKLGEEEYAAFSGEIKQFGGYWSRYAKGFLFKDEAKAQRFKDGVNDGSVRLNAMFVPYAEKLADVMMNFDKYADKAYDFVSDFVRDVDSNGVPKPIRESKNTAHAMANNFFGWLRDNMVLGGGRANRYLEVLRDYTNTKGEIAGDALKMREALSNLTKEDSQDLVRALGGDLPTSELNVGMMPIYEKFRKMIDAQTDELIKAGALDEKYAKSDYVKRYYFEHIAKEKSFVNMKGSEAQSAKYARTDMTLEERIALGQVEDAGYVVAKTIMEQRDQLNRAKFFTKLANEVGSNEPIEGFVKVPDAKAGIINKWGDLNNKYIPKQVWDDLRGSAKMYDELSGIEQFVAAWMSGIQHIKTNMTVKNLGTHLYNILSNGYIAYLDGHMTHLGRVVKDRGLYKQLHDEANHFGLDSMLDDLEGVAFKERSEDGVLLSLLKNAYMAEGTKVGDAMRKAYAHEDAAFKIAAYLKRKEQLQLEKFLAANPELKLEHDGGMINAYLIANKYQKDIQNIALSENEMRSAFESVDEVYVNYGTPLPAGVKNLDRSGLFPFMHYTWKATPIFLKQMMRHPYKVAMLHVAAGSYGLSKIWGESDERDKVTPEWMNDGFNMLGLDNYKEVDKGEYLNVGRSVPGMRFMNKSPISIFLGLDGGILANMFGISVLGMDNKGYSVDGGKYDSSEVKLAKRASALAEQVMPPLFPALPLVVRPKVDSHGKEVKDTKEVVAFGGRYFQKAYDAAAGKKDKRGAPLEVIDVAKQAVGVKLQKADNLSYGQKSVNAARKKFEREFNSAKSPMERAEAKRAYDEKIKKVKEQLDNADKGKLKIQTKLPGEKSGSGIKVFSKKKMIDID
ncbi:MAG: DEAD/DEAH box helicase family protein [Sulfurimonas sp.]